MSILLSLFFACSDKHEHDHDTATDTAEPSSEASSEPSSEASSEPSSEASTEPAGEPSTEPAGDAANGESIVTSTCMGCHNSNPAIENSSNMTDEEIVDLLDNGKGYMPPQSLSDQEKLDVIAYLRQEYGIQ